MNKIQAKKSLGQNFLKDESILSKIVNSIEIKENDLVIEVGPGMGALTKKIKEKKPFLIAYEIDERLKEYLLPLEEKKIKIKFGDFLKTNIKEDIKNSNYNHLYVMANIPYYITTPIIEHIINENIDVSAMTLLVQKEVGQRFCAQPNTKEYGAITVFLNYYFEIEKVCDVKNTCFYPQPKVDSVVIKFTKKEEKNLVSNEKEFFSFVKTCFQQKRKTLKNNLKEYDFQKIASILQKNNIDLNCRAEELSLEIFIEIYNYLGN